MTSIARISIRTSGLENIYLLVVYNSVHWIGEATSLAWLISCFLSIL